MVLSKLYVVLEFYEYPDGSGYEGRFTQCGICTLMQELGLYDLTPALCHLDYAMSEAGGVTNFVRQYAARQKPQNHPIPLRLLPLCRQFYHSHPLLHNHEWPNAERFLHNLP